MAIRDPMPAPLTRGFDRAVSWATGLGMAQAWLWTTAITAAIGVTAALVGAGYSFAALFILPTSLAAWSLGAAPGLAIGIIGATISVSINGHGPAFAPAAAIGSGVAAGWNMGMRGFAAFVTVMLVAGFRRTFDIERWRASHDALTGALNKPAFFSEFDRVTQPRDRSAPATFALAYVDLDGFKQVNDTHGHGAGDEVLKRFAAGAAELMRKDDRLARFGGDEFVILLRARDAAEALKAVERVHHRLTTLLRSFDHPVGCSTGAVICDDSCGLGAGSLIESADALMYEVKRAGRNALRIAVAANDPAGAREEAAVEIAA